MTKLLLGSNDAFTCKRVLSAFSGGKDSRGTLVDNWSYEAPGIANLWCEVVDRVPVVIEQTQTSSLELSCRDKSDSHTISILS